MRWIVGDLHGCARELEDLLLATAFDPAKDELWSAGDLVNGGPCSAQTLRLWSELGGRGVLGNHDVYALLVRSRAIERRPDRLDELFRAPDCDTLLERLRALPAMVAFEGEDGAARVWLVHAGIHPRWTDLDAARRRLESESHDDVWLRSPDVGFATRVRCCSASGDRVKHVGRPEDCPPPHRAWDVFYRGTDLIVHGHWAHRGFYRDGRTLGLDSGCVYGGYLTAWCLEEDRIVQVPARNPLGYRG